MVMCIGERTCFSAAFRADSALVDGQTAQQVGGMVIVLDVREPLSPQAAAGADAGAHRRLPNLCVPAFPACQFNGTFTARHPETRERPGANRSAQAVVLHRFLPADRVWRRIDPARLCVGGRSLIRPRASRGSSGLMQFRG